MNDLTQDEADRLAKWRWGPESMAGAGCERRARVQQCIDPGSDNTGRLTVFWEAATFLAAFRASMSSPMTDRDAELEAKLRWGMDGFAIKRGSWMFVGRGDGVHGYNSALGGWGGAFKHADARPSWIGPLSLVECLHVVSGNDPWVRPEVIRPDLTRDEALAQAQSLWGERAYAFEAVGKAPLAVGCPGIANGTGQTFREAFADAERRRVWLALATAFGVIGCAAVRERNKQVGQALMQPPKWAYPSGWRNAVMAAVEWCNAQPEPVRFQTAVLKVILEGYHEKRRAGWTAKKATEEFSRGGRLDAMDRAALAAYERGRGR